MISRGPFSDSYREARQRFLEVCESRGFHVTGRRHPLTGPDGEQLFTDFAEIGSASSSKLLLINSATHGAEGFSGSAAIIDWLASGRPADLAEDVRVVCVHALNPHGFAWVRRVNEDNVDLNRNFVSDYAAAPRNEDYDQFHRVFLPELWDDRTAGTIREALAASADEQGLLRMQARVCRGQYRHPDGVFFGGSRNTWSHRVFDEIVSRSAGSARHVVLIDFHTGLGNYGVPELICSRPPDGFESWFSDRVTCAQRGDAVGPRLTGTIGQGLRRLTAGANVYSITAEFGTYDVHRVLMAIVADNWLHLRGDLKSTVGERIKREIRASFYPDRDDWRDAVVQGSRRVLDQALRGLASLQ